jgi:chitinase
LRFLVQLSSPTCRTVTVDYTTANGTATEGQDYTAAANTLVFAPGTRRFWTKVFVIDDPTAEETETVLLTLSNPTEVAISGAQGTGVIVDDDQP